MPQSVGGSASVAYDYPVPKTACMPGFGSHPNSDSRVYQEMPATRASREGNLHPHDNAPVVCPIVAVVKEADVPVGTHGTDELHQRTGTFRKLIY